LCARKNFFQQKKSGSPQISLKALDFHTHIVEDENGSEMKVFVRYGNDFCTNKEDYPNEYAAPREIIEIYSW